VLLSDTVGFIRQLPHSLIKAFHSTLEEAALADLLIHVLDASEADIENYHKTTLAVLRELGAEQIPMITVLNKIDRLETPASLDKGERMEGLLARFPGSLPLSALNRIGLEDLKERIALALTEKK
jgi:GTP-binding protein HflX